MKYIRITDEQYAWLTEEAKKNMRSRQRELETIIAWVQEQDAKADG